MVLLLTTLAADGLPDDLSVDFDGDGVSSFADQYVAEWYLEATGLTLEQLMEQGAERENGVIDLTGLSADSAVPVGCTIEGISPAGPEGSSLLEAHPSVPIKSSGATTAGKTLRVPQDYPTIQAAYDAADPWDTIEVSQNAQGYYEENLDILKDGLTIRSVEQGVIIRPKDITKPIMKLTDVTFYLEAFSPASLTLENKPNEGEDDKKGAGALYAHFSPGHTSFSQIWVEGAVTFQKNLVTVEPAAAPAIDVYSEQSVAICEVVITYGVSFLDNDSNADHVRSGAVALRGPLDHVEISDGVTFAGNRGRGNTSPGALLIEDATDAYVTGCSFEANTAPGRPGGAIRMEGGALHLSDCDLTDNWTYFPGGAIYLSEMNRDIEAQIVECSFSSNHAGIEPGAGGGGGGAIYHESAHSVSVELCQFVGNSSAGSGGAICANDPLNMELVNCVFKGNSNSSPDDPGSVVAQLGTGGGPQGLRLYNCTLAENGRADNPNALTVYGQAGGAVALMNNILWGNTGLEDIYPAWAFESTAFNNDIEKWPEEWDPGHNENISADPVFFADGLHLKDPASPCIDAGSNQAPVTTDFDYDTRADGALDIGADEFTEFVRGDANDDGSYEIGDAIFILNYLFGGPAPHSMDSADANDDGKVDMVDAMYILEGGTPQPPFPTCGSDPTWDDGLRCDRYDHCP